MLLMSSLYYLSSLSYLIMGLFTFKMERKQKANILYFAASLSFAAWAFFTAAVMISDSPETATRFRTLATYGWSIVYSFILHFFIEFSSKGTSPKKKSLVKSLLLFIAVYLPALFSIYLYVFLMPSTPDELIKTSFGWAFINKPRNFLWDNYFIILYLVYTICSIAILTSWAFRAPLKRIQKMARMIIFTMITALGIGIITDAVLPMTVNNFLPPLGSIAALVPMIGVRYATSKYRLLSLDPFRTARDILHRMQEGLLLINPAWKIVEANREAGLLLGYEPEDLIGQDCTMLIDPSARTNYLKGNGKREVELVRSDGRKLPVLLTSEMLTDQWHDVIGSMVLFQDLTEIKSFQKKLQSSRDLLEARVKDRTSKLTAINKNLEHEIMKRIQMEEKIRTMAFSDQLTQLANRRLFTDRLEQAIFDAGKNEAKLLVLFINIDAFKLVNDTYGHLQGDNLLVAIAKRMKHILGEQATIARSGGDDFIMLQRFSAKNTSLLTEIEVVRSVFQKPYLLNEHEVKISAAIGISLFPDDGSTTDQLIKNAEIAMKEAKKGGRNQFGFFTTAMKEEITREMAVSNDLYKALENHEFILHYQPQVDPVSEKIIGMEALIRWNHPEDGMLSPELFIPIAEKNSLIIPIGEWALRETCRQMQQWRTEGVDHVVIAVNLSILQLKNSNIVELIANVLAETGLPPELLEVEITESILITNTDEIIAVLNHIRNLGVRVTIDDFGTGYSSLNYLKLLPLNRMKIAKEFVEGIGSSAADEAIISAIIVMARSMGHCIIAEGVETKEQLDFLTARSCDIVQGYYFSKPVNNETMRTLLMTNKKTFS